MTLDPTNLETGVEDPAAEGQNSEEPMVPRSALLAEREKRQLAEDKATLYAAQLRMGVAQPPVQQGQGQQVEEEDLLPGVDPDEPLTKKEVAQMFGKALKRIEAKTNAMTDEAQFLARHPDYEEVVTKHLPTLFEQEPELLRRLQRNPDPYLAYKLGVTSPSYQAQIAKDKIAKQDMGKKAQDNANRPGSASQVSGKTGQHPGDKFANMSRDEFRAHMDKVKRGGR